MADSYNELFGLGSHSADANLVGRWAFQDDAASTTVAAATGSDGVLNGGNNTSDISATGPGAWLSKAFSLSTTDELDLPDNWNPGGTSYTICGWVTQSDSTKSRNLQFIDTNLGRTELIIKSEITSGYLTVNNQINFTDYDLTSTTALSSSFLHFGYAWDSGDTSHRLVVNGTQEDSAGTTASDATPVGTNNQIGNTSAAGNDWEGSVAEWCRFSRALTNAEIAQVYNGPEPINTVAPVVSGTETVGSTLSCTTGTWNSQSNGTITYAYQWTRSDDATGTNEADIGGATSSTYTLVAGDSGKYIRCRVRASNDGGFDSAADTNSNFTGAITGGGGGDPEGSLTRGKLVGGGLLITGVLV